MSEPTALGLAKGVLACRPVQMTKAVWAFSARRIAEALIRRDEGVEPSAIERLPSGRLGGRCVCCAYREDTSNYCPYCGTRLKWPKA